MTLQTHHAPFPFPVHNWDTLPRCLGSGQACYGLYPWGLENEKDVSEAGYGLLGPHTAVLSQLVTETGAEGPQGPEVSWKMLCKGSFTSDWRISKRAALFLSHTWHLWSVHYRCERCLINTLFYVSP